MTTLTAKSGFDSTRMTSREKSARIIKWIRHRDKTLRRRYAFLKHQDAIGMSITLLSAGGMIFLGVLYILEFIPGWACVIGNAVLASFLHEIEHDLIHNLYFKGRERIQNFMFWIVWLFRANVVNSWFRREVHLLHHKVSGHADDIEERYIGNGMKWGWKRVLTMIDPVMAHIFRGPVLLKDARHRFAKITVPAIKGPFRLVYLLLWYTFLVWGLVSLVSLHVLGLPSETGVAATIHGFINTAAVIYLIPCWLRQTAIQIVSSNMHYYGDVNGLYEQTQVLDSWAVLPLHLFCFNFGSTHGIHHFYVNQPFYLRQWVAPFVKPFMRKMGIRFNDFRSMLRGNSFQAIPS